jgi:hypothetical protein
MKQKLLFLIAMFICQNMFYASAEPIAGYRYAGDAPAADSAGNFPDMILNRGKANPDTPSKGVRLDEASFSSNYHIVLTNAFSVSVWVRPLAFGKKALERGWPNGMIVNSGSGYYDGWRLVVQEPERFRLVFEIGRAEGSVSITSATSLTPSIWHHVVATWAPIENSDFGRIRLYIDGNLEADSKEPVPSPLPPNAPLSVGYTDFGVGTLLMDIAELNIHDRALETTEIIRHFLNGDYIQDEAEPHLLAGMLGRKASLVEKSDGEAAKKIWQQIINNENFPVVYRILAAERIKEHDQVSKLAERSDAPEVFKMKYELDGYSNSSCVSDEIKSGELPELKLYVATDGDDNNSGTFEAPFATLEAARDAVRKQRENGELKDIAIMIAPGRYSRSETFTLSENDGGSSKIRTIYSSIPDSPEPVLDGGFHISGTDFKPVDDETVLKRLPDKNRSKVLVADVSGKIQGQNAFGVGESTSAALMLIADEKLLLTPSRWPEKGFITGNNSDGNITIDTKLSEERISRWLEADAPMAHGYWKYDWADTALPIKFKEAGKNILQFTLKKNHCYGLSEQPRFFFFNLLEELDAPGEWHYDSRNAKLYIIPPHTGMPKTLTLTGLSEPMLEIRNVRNIEFRGISFSNSRGDAVRIKNADNSVFDACIFNGIGGAALKAENCPDLKILNSRFSNLGHLALNISAGDRKKLIPGGIKIHGNTFSYIGQYAHTYNPAILVYGVGANICHNVCHDIPSSAMRIEGNDHIIEHNVMYDVVLESDDQGAIDMWGDPSYRRCIFRYNTFKNIGSEAMTDCGRAGIRLDDAISGMIIYGNEFINSSQGNFGGVQIHGGNNNYVYDNRFIDCKKGVSFSPWGQERWIEQLDKNMEFVMKIRNNVDISSPPYTTRYPEIEHIREDYDKNFIWGNTFIRCDKPMHNAPIQMEWIGVE